jgi:hypothetical protein
MTSRRNQSEPTLRSRFRGPPLYVQRPRPSPGGPTVRSLRRRPSGGGRFGVRPSSTDSPSVGHPGLGPTDFPA